MSFFDQPENPKTTKKPYDWGKIIRRHHANTRQRTMFFFNLFPVNEGRKT
jgi:hypothetical protein